jgi:cell division protease FtsH
MLGGRAAELVVFGDRSTGAQNDLERATETAHQMVCRFGMSEILDGQTFGRAERSRFLEMPMGPPEERNFSEETARTIDHEVARILEEERDRADRIVRERRPVLEAIASYLLENETLERADLDRLVAAQPMAAFTG